MDIQNILFYVLAAALAAAGAAQYCRLGRDAPLCRRLLWLGGCLLGAVLAVLAARGAHMALSAMLILLSLALAAAGPLQCCRLRWSTRLTQRLLWLTGSLIAGILTLELAYDACTGQFSLTLLTDVMQAFSLDADYGGVFGRCWEPFPQPVGWLLAGYAFVLYTAAPIAGGAVIYQVLAGVSPRLAMSRCKKRELYVFSALNERSVTLAESIAEDPERKKYAIVFTDSYVDSTEEAETELLMRAKAIGAVCLQDDLLHCASFRKSKKCHFFLIDAAEDGGFDDEQDLATLCGLLSTAKDAGGAYAPVLWNESAGCVIYVFTNSVEAVETIRSLEKSFYQQRAGSVGEVELHVFRENTRAALYLVERYPLYLPLLDADTPPTALRVVLFGNSAFAREMFKTVFWCGQMLDVQLYITVVSRRASGGERPAFLQWLDRLSPEIAASCVHPDGQGDRELLRIRPGEDKFAPPYARLSFIETDGEPDLRRLLSQDRQRFHDGSEERWRLADSDYFLVMEDSDLENIALADSLRSTLIGLHLQHPADRHGRQIISFAVRSDSLQAAVSDRFAKRRAVALPPAVVSAPEMHPFGSLREQFNWKNVSLDEAQLSLSGKDRKKSIKEHGVADINEARDPLYDDWSTAARQFHLRYKLFSAQCLRQQQAGPELAPEPAPEQAGQPDGAGPLRAAAARGRLWLRSCLCIDPPSPQTQEPGPEPLTAGELLRYYCRIHEDSRLMDRLSWLEHRRWCAFMRVSGFTRPFVSIGEVTRFLPDMDGVLRARTNGQVRQAAGGRPGLPEVPKIYGLKDVPYRLHPCLVEAAQYPYQDAERPDMLDVICAARLYIEKDRPDLADDGRRPDPKKYDRPSRYLHTMDRGEKALVRAAIEARLAGGELSDEDEAQLRLLARWLGPYPEPRSGQGMWVIKKPGRPVTAFPLGQGHPLEAALTDQGRLRRLPDGGYEVSSRETSGGAGELAQAGDYVKLDAGGWPYPNRRAFFLAEHEHLQGDSYVQHPVPRSAWLDGRPLTEEMSFALEKELLRLDPADPERYFSARQWSARLTAPRDAAVVFYQVDRDSGGGIADMDFNFVVREEFDAAYDILE